MLLSRKNFIVWFLFFTLVFTAILTGCSKRDSAEQISTDPTVGAKVDLLSLTAIPSSVTIDTVGTSGESDIVVLAKTSENVGVPNVEVILSTDLGYVQSLVRTDSTGSATVKINNAGSDGTATIKAYTVAESGDTLRAETTVEFNINQQDPTNEILRLQAEPTIIFSDNNETTSTIRVLLTDLNGEPIPDRTIYFSAVGQETGGAIGSIEQTVETNESGRDSLIFGDGGDEGVAMIIGRSNMSLENSAKDTLFITIEAVPSDSIASIELEVDDFDIQVKGTGGDETATYMAWLYDENNNLVPDGKQVTFEILYSPDSLVYFNSPYLQTVNSATAGGVATALIYSGRSSGTVRVRATAASIVAENSQVVIGAGPPAIISVFHDAEGEPIGGGMWQIGVSAVVDDQYGNSVAHGTAVFFELNPPEHPSVIYPFAYTGNGVDGVCSVEVDSTGGIAFTCLEYSALQMFSQVVIIASSDTVSGQLLATLPFQNPEDGSLLMIVIPTVIYCGGGQATAQVTAILLDGYGYPVSGGTIVFENAVAGQILSNPVVTDENGEAPTLIRFTQSDFPGEATQVTAIVRSKLQGYDLISDDVSITVFK
ncbi:MAG: hypothetical protein B6244_09155 [Candidatus Cloacimonetes bacterium 4572_55]|nr:MAG: hypothetical protein B6244_09155 [Candidatus Cloacimonetes bacterium 4572_55]